MPLVYQQNINLHTRLGVWHIAEDEAFFTDRQIPPGRDITHPKKRLQHLAGRMLLKELYADFPYDLIRIADTRKPFIENESYHFSISHCGSYAAAIVSKTQRVGIDVELFTNKVLKVKHKFLSPAEQNLLAANGPGDTPAHSEIITVAWSIKESLYKWFGEGELDFIEHMQIDNIALVANTGTAVCRILKRTSIQLNVDFIYFEGNCLSWVVS